MVRRDGVAVSGRVVFFVVTDTRCVVRGNAYPGIPIFFDADGVIEPFSDYMVHVVREQRRPATTARTYAAYLQKFLKHLDSIGVEWTDVADGTLVAWRDALLTQQRLAPGTVGAYLSAAFSFYRWAEESGRVRYAVNLSAGRDSPRPTPDERSYRISARRSRRGDLYWPHLPKDPGGAVRHTPSHDETERVHVQVFETQTGERDSLLLSFYEDCYLRRSEALSLTVGDIPFWEDIERKLTAAEVFTLHVRGKGGNVRRVFVLPELMELAREHIEGERARVIARARSRDARYVDPGALFLSYTTGRALTHDYVSARISKAMRAAGVENASGHRLRASGLTALVAAYDGYDEAGKLLSVENVLWKAAEYAGHRHWRTLEPYLRVVRSAGLQPQVDLRLRDHTRVGILERRVVRLKAELRARRTGRSHR